MLSSDKVNVNLGCGGWVIPVTFIISDLDDYWNDLEADYWNSLEKEGL